MFDYSFYTVDTETTGLDSHVHDVIELSLIRMRDGEQKTWFLKPFAPENADPGALRINGHKMEDLRGETVLGKEKYLNPIKILPEIENWIAEDNVPRERIVLIGQNVPFDKGMLEQLWKKCNSADSFPFGRRTLDTQVIELFLDFVQGEFSEGYSLANLTKKYSVKNDKAHSAAADTKATSEVFTKQVSSFRQLIKRS
jgi:DNA polymerase III epsilon subunit-like protein